jgi:hypothetical protein
LSVNHFSKNAKRKMKNNLILALLKPRNQYLLQLLVISIFILVFNTNEISSCMDNEQGPKNFPEALKEAADNQDVPEIANILRSLSNITDPVHRENIQNILNRHLNLPDQYQINTQTFTVTQANTGNIPVRSWVDILTPILLVAGLTLSIWLIVRYYDNIHQLFFDVGDK